MDIIFKESAKIRCGFIFAHIKTPVINGGFEV